jgi:hypothetical protein
MMMPKPIRLTKIVRNKTTSERGTGRSYRKGSCSTERRREVACSA